MKDGGGVCGSAYLHGPREIIEHVRILHRIRQSLRRLDGQLGGEEVKREKLRKVERTNVRPQNSIEDFAYESSQWTLDIGIVTTWDKSMRISTPPIAEQDPAILPIARVNTADARVGIESTHNTESLVRC